MQIWQAILLGFTQGFCEFLPVSSSGHLLLFQRWLGIKNGGLVFDVFLHLGTLIPVLIIFKKEIFALFKKPFINLGFLIIATLPAIVFGFLFSDRIETYFYSGQTLSAVLLSATFLLTAIELYFAQKIIKKRKKFLPLSNKVSFVMGMGQALAIVPGLSRSGTVISFGAFSGLEKEKIAPFAFLMSIPVILGACVLSGAKAVGCSESIEILPLLFGVLSSAVTGYLAISVMLNVVKRANYTPFCVYLILMAALSILSNIWFGV